MAFLLEPQDNMEAWHGAHVAERRTPARQSDDTQCSGVLVSLDIAQWGGGGEDSRVWLRCDMLHATFSSDGSLRASHLGCDVVGTLTENVASPW